jgi:hypothetical protein
MANRSEKRGRPPRRAFLLTRDGGHAVRIDEGTRLTLGVMALQDSISQRISEEEAAGALLARLIEAERQRRVQR